MREIEPPFEIQNNGVTAKVSEHSINGERVFHLIFSDERKPLSLVVGQKQRTNEKFWTSLPQGRQEEAEAFGKLIAIYIRSKRKQQ